MTEDLADVDDAVGSTALPHPRTATPATPATTARAVRLRGPRSVDVVDVELPPPLPGQVRVRTLASGISAGTELTAYRGTNPYLTAQWDPRLRLFTGRDPDAPAYPLVGWGYSEVGEVVEAPDEDAGLAVGDVVWGIWGHVSQAVLPVEGLRGHRLPDGLEPVAGCFVRVGAVALNAVLAGGAGLGDTVVVLGQGVLGLLATSFAAAGGARVIAVEGLPERRALSLELGAQQAFAPGPEVAVAVRELTGGRGADVAIDLTGAYPALHEAIRLTGVDGRVVAAGFYQGAAEGLRLGEEFHHNRVEILVSQIGAVAPAKRARWDVPRLQETVLDLLARRRPDVSRLVTHRFDLEDAARAYRLLDTDPAGVLQVVLEVPGGCPVTAILVQEQHLPGRDLEEKWAAAQGWGYDGIELRGAGDLGFAARLPQLRRAAAAGVPMPTVCVDMLHFVGDFDAGRRADARVQLRSQLSVIAELGGRGAMTPASYGMFSRRLPPFEPPRSAAEDRAVLIDGLGELGRHAESEGVVLFLEPLNRYEDHMVNRLAEGVSLLREIGLESVRLGADTYHMNIEEADPAAALRQAAPWIGHVQVSDSNRLEPGAGHVDWPLLCATLAGIGYTGPVALESRLSGPAEVALPSVPALLRPMLSPMPSPVTGSAG